MADFSHLSELDQKPQTEFPYKFTQIKGAPTIWFYPATDANPAFLNETLRRANNRAGQNRRGTVTTPETLRESRQEDREVFSKTCARRWDVTDAKGNAVEFSAEECLQFFEALPTWIFDDLRAWLPNAANFLRINNGDDALGEG